MQAASLNPYSIGRYSMSRMALTEGQVVHLS